MARVNKVAHVVLSVKDVMTSVDFYTKARLGWRWWT